MGGFAGSVTAVIGGEFLPLKGVGGMVDGPGTVDSLHSLGMTLQHILETHGDEVRNSLE